MIHIECHSLISVVLLQLLTILALHVMYSKILFKYWRLKRRMSLRKRRQQSNGLATLMTNEAVFGLTNFQSLFPDYNDVPVLVRYKSNDLTLSTIESKPSASTARKTSLFAILMKIQDFMDAAKYVIVLLFVFTICWLPWLVLFSGDMLYHRTGFYDQTIQVKLEFFS